MPRAPILLADVGAQHARAAGIGANEACDHVDEGRLAGAVGSEQAEKLAFVDGQADAGERFDGAVALLDAADFQGFQCCDAAAGSRPSTPYSRAMVRSASGRFANSSGRSFARASRSQARSSARSEESSSDTSPTSTV